MTLFDEVISFYGSQAKLAKEFGVTPQAVSNWRQRGVIPKAYLVDIHRKTKIPFERLLTG